MDRFNFYKFLVFLTCLFLNLPCGAYEPVQTVVITQEDIQNAKPTKAKVNLNNKELKAIETMEKRHFGKTYPEFSQAERLKNLEFELLGRAWQYSPTYDRIRKLKIASSNTMLSGMALPPAISSKRMAKRAKNTSIQMRQRDDVGLIDGFLRLMNPDMYEMYRKRTDKFFEMEY